MDYPVGVWDGEECRNAFDIGEWACFYTFYHTIHVSCFNQYILNIDLRKNTCYDLYVSRINMTSYRFERTDEIIRYVADLIFNWATFYWYV